MIPFLSILLALALWGALHSLTAALAAKAWVRQRLGPFWGGSLYRLAFNAVSVITFLPVLVLIAIWPGPVLYQFPGWLSLLAVAVQAISALAAVVVLWQVDLFHFLGLRQLVVPPTSQPTAPQLYTQGAYAWVRHPLYFFSLVLIWVMPVMTTSWLAFCLSVTAYFYVGSIFEERKLVAEFGDAYRQHQRRVPRLLPWPRPKSPAISHH